MLTLAELEQLQQASRATDEALDNFAVMQQQQHSASAAAASAAADQDDDALAATARATVRDRWGELGGTASVSRADVDVLHHLVDDYLKTREVSILCRHQGAPVDRNYVEPIAETLQDLLQLACEDVTVRFNELWAQPEYQQRRDEIIPRGDIRNTDPGLLAFEMWATSIIPWFGKHIKKARESVYGAAAGGGKQHQQPADTMFVLDAASQHHTAQVLWCSSAALAASATQRRP